MFIHKMSLSCLCACLLAAISPQVLAAQPITDIFPAQSQFHTHGSNIQFFQLPGSNIKQLFTVWFQGDGERAGNNVQIFGALRLLTAHSWTAPVPLTVKDVGYPDVNPALYVGTDSKGNNKFYLFWEKIYFHQWEGAVVHTNVATFTGRIRSLKHLAWSDPGLEGKNITSAPEVLFPSSYWLNVKDQLDNTWPLKQGKFKPFGFKNAPTLTVDDVQRLYNIARLRLAFFTRDDYRAFKLKIMNLNEGVSSDNQKLIAQSNSFRELFNREKKSSEGVRNDLISFMYWIYDMDASLKMRDTLLNPKSKYYRTGWETRSKPLRITLKNGAERLLLPLYSDLLNFSLVIYSDDHGASWRRANNPIMSRAGIQPALIRLS